MDRLLLVILLASPWAPAMGQGGAAAPRPRGSPVAAVPAGVATLIPAGLLEVLHGDGSSTRLSAPASLTLGDEIRTGGGNYATIRFSDGSEVRLEPWSTFVLQQVRPGLFSMLLSSGKLWAVVTKEPRRRFQVRTPTAVASVRGTEFSVEVVNVRKTIAAVRAGLVAVQGLVADRMNGPEVLLEPGRSVSVVDGQVGPPQPLQGKRDDSSRENERAATLKADIAREAAAQSALDASQSGAFSAAINPQANEGAALLQSAVYQTNVGAAAAPLAQPVSVTGVSQPVENVLTQPPASTSETFGTGSLLDCPGCPKLP